MGSHCVCVVFGNVRSACLRCLPPPGIICEEIRNGIMQSLGIPDENGVRA